MDDMCVAVGVKISWIFDAIFCVAPTAGAELKFYEHGTILFNKNNYKDIKHNSNSRYSHS